jgi:TrmH family RNA methyltransferase
MLTKAIIKLLQSLKDKKGRQEQGLFLVEGTKTVLELLGSKIEVKSLFATHDWLTSHQQLLKSIADCNTISEKELKQLSNLVTPQQVIAVAKNPQYQLSKIEFKNKFTIALDTIQDPGNLGTIIRIADWYGIESIVCSPTCADVFNPKVIQATMGSFIRVKIFYTELSSFFEGNKNQTVYGALMNGENLYQTKINKEGVLLIGNEGSGISEELLKYISKPITIPKIGGAESLNAGIATAIICDAWARGLC